MSTKKSKKKSKHQIVLPKEKPESSNTPTNESKKLPEEIKKMLAAQEKEILSRIAELTSELDTVLNDTHPKLVSKVKDSKQKQVTELELIQIHEELERERIERKYQLALAQNERDKNERLEEIKQILLREIDHQELLIEAETDALDIGGSAQPTFAVNQRGLRRAAAATTSSKSTSRRQLQDPVPALAEPKHKKTTKAIEPTINYLLSDEQIAADLALICPAALADRKKQSKIAVTVDSTKVVYDGKIFLKLTPLIVKSKELQPFTGLITQIVDNVITLRPNMSGDPRTIVCTIQDLEYGVVQLMRIK